jgi:hypothetical protein
VTYQSKWNNDNNSGFEIHGARPEFLQASSGRLLVVQDAASFHGKILQQT